MTTERPMLFSAPMIRALLAGTKSQTRRVVKDTGLYAIDAAIHGAETAARELQALASRCPYGQPGHKLWVREAFIHEPADYCWEASVSIPSRPACTVYRADAADPSGGTWKPSIHMPRALSRITLEVTGVRVERLQAISEADARAEGYELGAPPCIDAPLRWYRHLWEQINGAGSWDANPWVWCVSFKRVEG